MDRSSTALLYESISKYKDSDDVSCHVLYNNIDMQILLTDVAYEILNEYDTEVTKIYNGCKFYDMEKKNFIDFIVIVLTELNKLEEY